MYNSYNWGWLATTNHRKISKLGHASLKEWKTTKQNLITSPTCTTSKPNQVTYYIKILRTICTKYSWITYLYIYIEIWKRILLVYSLHKQKEYLPNLFVWFFGSFEVNASANIKPITPNDANNPPYYIFNKRISHFKHFAQILCTLIMRDE